ncbi:MAG: hypothetical protein ACOCVM_02210 [Desulfovibrionaceae bacterium]
MPDRIYRITAVEKTAKPYELLVTWEDGVTAAVDVQRYVEQFKVYASLRGDGWEDCHPFVGEYGWSAAWVADEVEMPSSTLRDWWMFQTSQAMHPKDFQAWMERHGLTLDAAAAALGVSRRMVAYYKGGKRLIPRTILLATKGYDVEVSEAA